VNPVGRPRRFPRVPRSGWYLSACVVAAFSGLGLLLDYKGFLVNVLAGVVTLVAGIVVTLTLVERYLDARRTEQWAKVRSYTQHAIAVHVCEIVGSLFQHYDLPYEDVVPFFHGHRDPFSHRIQPAFDALLSALRADPPAATENNSPSDQAISYQEAVGWDLSEVANVLTPRLLEAQAEQRLVDGLVDFDEARRQLRHSIIAHQQAVTQNVFPSVVELVESAKRLHRELVLAQRGGPAQP